MPPRYTGTCFLVCGGPSLKSLDMTLLNQRGVMVAALNQAGATLVRPHFWFAVDDPCRFHESIWLDPAIAKFVPRSVLGKPTARWDGTAYVRTGRTAGSYPNVSSYRGVRSGFDPATFFTVPYVVWGGLYDPHGERRKTRSVMLPALRTLHDLGFTRIVIIGADFHMEPRDPYAFDDPKDVESAAYNNRSYAILNEWFGQLRPFAEARGLAIQNATGGGALTAFERIGYETAVREAALPSNPHVAGHYRVRFDDA